MEFSVFRELDVTHAIDAIGRLDVGRLDALYKEVLSETQERFFNVKWESKMAALVRKEGTKRRSGVFTQILCEQLLCQVAVVL